MRLSKQQSVKQVIQCSSVSAHLVICTWRPCCLLFTNNAWHLFESPKHIMYDCSADIFSSCSHTSMAADTASI